MAKVLTDNEQLKKIARIDNRFNQLDISRLKAIQLDFFMTILVELANKNHQTVLVPLKDIKEGVESSLSYKRTVNYVFEMAKEVSSIKYIEKDKDSFSIINVFEEISFDGHLNKNGCFKIRATTAFIPFINDLFEQFTLVYLNDFKKIRSSYSKIIYLHLMQFSSTGLWRVNLDNFRKILDIPDSYQFKDINKRVLKPALKDLGFLNISIDKIIGNQQGNPVVGLAFHFNKSK